MAGQRVLILFNHSWLHFLILKAKLLESDFTYFITNLVQCTFIHDGYYFELINKIFSCDHYNYHKMAN